MGIVKNTFRFLNVFLNQALMPQFLFRNVIMTSGVTIAGPAAQHGLTDIRSGKGDPCTHCRAGISGVQNRLQPHARQRRNRKPGGESAMPQIDYRCKSCRHEFHRLVFLGDAEADAVCPACGSSEVEKSTGAEPVFNGIASFSSLAGDRN